TLLVLDEPTSQLDPSGAAAVLDLLLRLSAEGITVVVASHEVDWLAASATRVVALDAGRVIADGTPAEVFGGDALVGRGVALPTATAAARALGWRRPDGSWPVTGQELAARSWPAAASGASPSATARNAPPGTASTCHSGPAPRRSWARTGRASRRCCGCASGC